MKRKPKLLWIGDAVCPTGFARVTHNVVPHLQERFDVTVLGINYNGDPHDYSYPIYPAKAANADDIWGLRRLPSIIDGIRPDVIFVNNDPWNIIRFPDVAKDIPVVAYMPIDAPNMKEEIAEGLNEIALSVFYTRFGVDMARAAGYNGLATVVPHGVDTDLYVPIDRATARKVVGIDKHLTPNSFIFGNVNRNQPRKRLDLSIMLFARLLEAYDLPNDVWLHLHCGLHDVGWDLGQLSKFFGVQQRVLFSDERLFYSMGIPETSMPYIYNCFDTQISTTMGEGWGLTTHEGMACGIPQIVPEWSALKEWPAGAVRHVPVSSMQVTAGGINTIGAVVDEDQMIKAMYQFYTQKNIREEYSRLGYDRAMEPQYCWSNVSGLLGDLLVRLLTGTLVNPLIAPKDSALDSLGATADHLEGLADGNSLSPGLEDR